MSKKVILMILDGWGLGLDPTVSAIAQAQTPFFDHLWQEFPHCRLEASGLAVGLPEGQMGNSEVGHMNIGAGRVVYQDLVKINLAAQDGSLAGNAVLQQALQYAQQSQKKMHLLGLVSDGGVHSHIEHLKSLCHIAHQAGLKQVFIHAFMDGRDTSPTGGADYLADLQPSLAATGVKIASLIGRYYAMDRDKRWERIQLAYDLLVKGQGQATQDPIAALRKSYAEGVTDEFIQPLVCTNEAGQPLTTIEEGDVVLFFNFRNDRARQLTQALTQEDFPAQGMAKIPLHYLTMTPYDETFANVKVLFEKDNLRHTLGEVLAQAGKSQIRIAETEKYPHVTFFFSGGREEPFEGEQRILCPSPKVPTYDLQPTMSAQEIRQSILPELKKGRADFICLNFANPDMVGHTGVFEAAIKACETVDQCTQEVVKTALENGYTCVIIADHGNADIMMNPDGSPHTAHTTNLVPCLWVDAAQKPALQDGKLGDIAPSILKWMGVPLPEEMTGQILWQ
ncbi:MAG: 2,3-bisphosphoglycerate-independent phosphoglycerate mutase [Microscillaceae bacterium]